MMSDFVAREMIRFLPGDRFAGWDRQSLIDRLVLRPKARSIDLSPATGPVELVIWIDDEEVDVVREQVRDGDLMCRSIDGREPTLTGTYYAPYDLEQWIDDEQ